MKSAPQKRARLRSRLLIAMATVVTSCLLAIAIPLTTHAVQIVDNISVYNSEDYWSSLTLSFRGHYNSSNWVTIEHYSQYTENYFYSVVPESISSQANTFSLYDNAGYTYHVYGSERWSGSYWADGFTLRFNRFISIGEGEQMEFWVKVNEWYLARASDGGWCGTWSQMGTCTALDPSGVEVGTFTLITDESETQDNQWQCYRFSAPADSSILITSLSFVPPVPWAGGYDGSMDMVVSFDLGPVAIGDLDNYDPRSYNDKVIGGIDDIINGDSLPDTPDPDYDNIQGNPDYNVGDKVGEDEAIGELGNMQAGADYYITSDGMRGAANFWQDVFRRFFNTTGAILMTSVSSVFIVLRALVGR